MVLVLFIIVKVRDRRSNVGSELVGEEFDLTAWGWSFEVSWHYSGCFKVREGTKCSGRMWVRRR